MIDPLTLASMIPTVMNLGSQIASLVPKREQRNFVPGGTMQYKTGGSVRGHKQYNAPSHDQGGQTINENGVPVPNTGHEVQKKEAAYKYSRLKNDTYIFPDTKALNKLLNKYKDANTNPQAKTALELEINKLEKQNEMKKAKTNKEYKKGGNVKYFDGATRNPEPKPINPGNPLTGLTGVNSLISSIASMYGKGFSNGIPSTNRMNELMGNLSRQAMAGGSRGETAVNQLPQIKGDPRINRGEKAVNPIPNQMDVVPRSYTKMTATDLIPGGMQNKDMTEENLLNKVNNYSAPITPNSMNDAAFSKDSKSSSFDPNKIARLAGQIGNSLQLLNKAENEKPVFTNYQNTRSELGNISNSTDALQQAAAQQANLTSNLNRSSASSFNQYANRQNQNFANLGQTLQNINLQGIQLKNQNAATRAQMESGIAQDNKQTIQQNRINNQMNEAQNRNIKRGVSSDILYELDRQSTIKNNRAFADATNQQGVAMLQSMFPDIGVNGLMVTALQKTTRGEKLTPEEDKAYKEFQTLTFKS